MKHSTKKLMSLVLTLVMGLMTLCNTIVASAGEVKINGQKASEGVENASHFTGEGYEIKYYVDNYNIGEYQEQIWITNTGDKTIENWKLKFNLPYNIDAICNGTWETYENGYQRCSDGTYLIPNQGWDANIEAGGCVQLSFTFKSDNGVVDPTEFQLLHSGMLNIEGEGYTIDHDIINYEASGYQDNITVTNTGDKVIHNWSLKFNSPYEIYAIYNGEWQTYESGYERCKDGSYIITNHVDNADIEPGSCVQLSCTFRTDEVVTEPTDSRLIQKEKICTQGNGYTMEYDVNNYRKDEYQTFITVTNTGEEAINNWSLKFDCPYKQNS
ncbi:Cellulose binding domain-containing protein [Hathewaya proteolytica DSM 3090]|uniref:Cellulose binding domain-containing protein n=1 Tax=Hathewaya proteolytica DSM 3090 TaxID=1121331 RepID=A0A1M6RVP4_9CLOT|nr:cellulose binding domain-containing protein [Hathewaya proteolytica]SHK36530.1 Cellulose binding domain-containing protein [Hathewaya proteolytica DSM 3090]